MRRTTAFLSQPLVVVATALALCALDGCTVTPREYWEALKGEGFPGWDESNSTGMRGNTKDVKPSGFFTDRRSEQIEKSLGGGF